MLASLHTTTTLIYIYIYHESTCERSWYTRTNGDFGLVKVTKDIRDVAIPLQLCCSPCHVEMGVKAPTSSVTSARKCILIGHRGAKDIEKENTLRSFYAAIDTKCDMVEFGEKR